MAEVLDGRAHLLATPGPTSVVFLRPGAAPRFVHRGEVVRLMVHPAAQGRGLGRALLDAAVAHARLLGLEQLLLSARGGTTLPAFYAGLGWTEVGVFPRALHLGGGERRDEHWFQLLL
ncbi:MAG: GNAT family N-acetyltransferase [Pseudonocardiales bacterium]|nr:GNAT family N-acetyltransferase [Pseudonocardiales bacterium]